MSMKREACNSLPFAFIRVEPHYAAKMSRTESSAHAAAAAAPVTAASYGVKPKSLFHTYFHCLHDVSAKQKKESETLDKIDGLWFVQSEYDYTFVWQPHAI